MAVAPLERKFWENFLKVLEAPQLLDDAADPRATREAVAAILATRTADAWLQRFQGVDACVSLVKSLEEAVATPHFGGRGLFEHQIDSGDGARLPALPLPIAPAFRAQTAAVGPRLGEADLDAVLQAGWSEDALHSAVAVTARGAFMHRLMAAYGFKPLSREAHAKKALGYVDLYPSFAAAPGTSA